MSAQDDIREAVKAAEKARRLVKQELVASTVIHSKGGMESGESSHIGRADFTKKGAFRS